MKFFAFPAALLVMFLSVGGTPSPEASGTARLRTAADIFSAPSEDSVIIDTLDPGAEIHVLETTGAWTKIHIPLEEKVWIASCFLKEDTITDGAIFRMGPSTAFPRILQTKSFAGQKADIIDTDKSGFWKKIRIREGLGGYIRSEPILPAGKKDTKVSGLSQADFFSGVSVEGRLDPLKKKIGGAQYQLTFLVNGLEYTMAYIISGKANMRLWEGKKVRVQGIGFWENGIRHPFVKVRKIEPVRQ